MASASIPVDLFNPGQVFACLGFLEAAEVLLSDAEGGFDWRDEADVRFHLKAASEENPIEAVLKFLDTADVKWLSPSSELKERDGGTTVVHAGLSSSRDPRAPDLPAVLMGNYKDKCCEIFFGYWADGSTRFSTTFKKSTNGASSHIRVENARDGIRRIDQALRVLDPLEQKARTESLFRWDPRGSVDPINAGTSPDKLRKGGIDMRVATYPICEMLAVIGLEHTRPEAAGPQTFSYCVWNGLKSDPRREPVLLAPSLARAALSGGFSFLNARRFIVRHEEVKKGGDRKMIEITEDTLHE